MKRQERVISGGLPKVEDRIPGEAIYLDDGSGTLQLYIIGRAPSKVAYLVKNKPIIGQFSLKIPPNSTYSITSMVPTKVPLNSESNNTVGTFDTKNSEVTLGSGLYRVSGFVNTYATRRGILRLKDIDDNVLYQTNGYTSGAATCSYNIDALISLTNTTTLYLEITTEYTSTVHAWGVTNNMTSISGDRTVASITIERM